MGRDPLHDAQIKLARADRHLAEFLGTVEAYFASGPLSLTQGLDADASHWVVKAKIESELPADAGAIVGDIAHNIRSALDGLVWELARLQTKKPGRTQFPIFTKPRAFKKGAHRMIGNLAPEHAAFLERLQPYRSDNLYSDPLFILNRLSNVDKHRHLHLATTALAGASLRIDNFEGYSVGGMALSFGSFRDGDELARLDVYDNGSSANPSINVSINGAFDLAVEDDGSDLSVAGGLVYAREFAGDIVDWFAPVFHP